MPQQAGAGVLLGAFVRGALNGLLLQPKCRLGVVGLVVGQRVQLPTGDSAQCGMSGLPNSGSYWCWCVAVAC